jgi:spoIIIJ-associated protein
MSENTELQAQVIEVLETMFGYLNIPGSFRIEDKNGRLAVKITTSDPAKVIGRRGQMLESLQVVVNRIMFKKDQNVPRILLDIDETTTQRERRSKRNEKTENDSNEVESTERPRKSRREFRGSRDENHNSADQLAKLAKDTAKEVKRWGEPVKMAAMNAHDRRIIHVTLQNDTDIVTESEGEGSLKQVVIRLRKEDEEIKSPAEARREKKQAKVEIIDAFGSQDQETCNCGCEENASNAIDDSFTPTPKNIDASLKEEKREDF